jgi:hypothetical protein
MDQANFNTSLSSMIAHDIFRDCNQACFNDSSAIPDKSCIQNCTRKAGQFLTVFNVSVSTTIPLLNEMSRYVEA